MNGYIMVRNHVSLFFDRNTCAFEHLIIYIRIISSLRLRVTQIQIQFGEPEMGGWIITNINKIILQIKREFCSVNWSISFRLLYVLASVFTQKAKPCTNQKYNFWFSSKSSPNDTSPAGRESSSKVYEPFNHPFPKLGPALRTQQLHWPFMKAAKKLRYVDRRSSFAFTLLRQQALINHRNPGT